ncbi:MAG: Thioredoxin reductase [Phycisphaerae bacterium]|nr:Thioredoxin reductase [Phycisphaerae bacterium]
MAELGEGQYDVIIVGAGPAGLAAGLYAARDRFKTLMLEKNGLPGGQIMLTGRIENYPGYENIPGPALVDHMVKQVKSFGAELKANCPAERIERLDDGSFTVHTAKGAFSARVIILSPGSDYRRLDVPGEKKHAGAGVSYCGTCDAPFFRDKHVVSIGGGNTAVEEAIHLAKFASKVTVVHRRAEFRAQKILVEELHRVAKERGNIEFKLEAGVTEILGDKKVDAVTLKDLKSGAAERFACDGVFIFVGMIPNTGWLKGFVELDGNDFIKADPAYMRTRVPGVFVAGDCRTAAAMQLATACGDGVVAAMMMKQHLKDPAWWTRTAEPEAAAAGGW